MSGEATATATAAPVQGEQTATPAPAGGELITREKMAEAINKRRAARGEKPIETEETERKAEEKAAEKVEDPTDQADEPKDEAKKPDEESAKALKELEAKVSHFEQRDAEWSSVTDKLIAQRDYYKQLAESVEGSLPQLGHEIDPTVRENLQLKMQLQAFNAEQERARAMQEHRAQQEQAQRLQAYTSDVVSVGQRLAQTYPELNPRTNPEVASVFFRGWAVKGGDAADLERAAKQFVAKVRGQKPTSPESPRTLAGSRAPRSPLPTGRDWNSVRDWAKTRFGQS